MTTVTLCASVTLCACQANLITDHAPLVTEITHDMNQHYSSLQKQHQDFVTHLTSQLAMLDQQIQQQLIVPGTLAGTQTRQSL